MEKNKVPHFFHLPCCRSSVEIKWLKRTWTVHNEGYAEYKLPLQYFTRAQECWMDRDEGHPQTNVKRSSSTNDAVSLLEKIYHIKCVA